MNNNIKILLGVVCAFILLISLLNVGQEKKPASNNKDFIPSEKKAVTYYSTLSLLEQTSKPMFIEGDEYVYNIWDSGNAPIATNPGVIVIQQPVEFTATIQVTKKERVDKEDYWKINTGGDEVIQNITIITKGNSKKVSEKLDITGYLYHVNTNNGSILQMNDSNSSLCFLCINFFYEWMLYLKPDIKWTDKVEKYEDAGYVPVFKMDYIVEGIENVNGRDCFKVTATGTDTVTSGVSYKGKTETKTKKILMKDIFFIDVEKRILVRMERFEDNVKIFRIELKDIRKI